MRRKYILTVLTLSAFLALAAVGCGPKKQDSDNPTKSGDVSGSSIKEKTKDTGKKTAEKTPASEKKDSKVKERKDYLEKDSNTPIDQIQGEGTTDQTVPDLSKADKHMVGDEVAVAKEDKGEAYTISIANAALTDRRDENNPSSPDQVVIIDYSYTNKTDQPLLLDDMSFKLVSGDTVYAPYYASFVKASEAAEAGQSSDGQLAYEVPASFAGATLVFTDPATGKILSYDIEV